MHNLGNRRSGTLALIEMMGFPPLHVNPTELLPTELILLGVVSVREAQLSVVREQASQAVMIMMDAVAKNHEKDQYIKDLEESNDVLLRVAHEEQNARSQERQMRIDAEDRFAQLRIRVEGLSEGLDSLADEAADALAEADEDSDEYGGDYLHATG